MFFPVLAIFFVIYAKQQCLEKIYLQKKYLIFSTTVKMAKDTKKEDFLAKVVLQNAMKLLTLIPIKFLQEK